MTQTPTKQNVLDFIDASPTMFHTTHSCINHLKAAHFDYLDPTTSWSLKQNGKYFTTLNDSSIIAFCIHSDDYFKIIGTHGDAPGFKIKPKAQIKTNEYIKLNTEGYGGSILNSWFDRPLSIAGRVMIRSNHLLHPITQLIDLKKPLLIIPSLAIHMNRNVNEGVAINKQKDTLPILTYTQEEVSEDMLLDLIAKTLDIDKTSILDTDLYLYPYEKGLCIGLNDVFLSAPRLDDLSMTYSGLYALLHHQAQTGISLFVCFDNEEIGSHTKQGADSPFLIRTMERILLGLNKSREDLFKALEQSFMVSADVAHLTHPNYTEESDPTNTVRPGQGPAIKLSANFSYTTDSDSFAVFSAICKANHIPYQTFVNRSDKKGGSTIGPITTRHLGIRCIDIGTPMLSMHSARELMAYEDFVYTTKALQAFLAL